MSQHWRALDVPLLDAVPLDGLRGDGRGARARQRQRLQVARRRAPRARRARRAALVAGVRLHAKRDSVPRA